MFKQATTVTVGIVLLAISGFAQEDPVVQWGKATTEKMSHFLPQPVAGLIPHEPWKPDGKNNVETSFGNLNLNFKYLIPRAEQTWWFDDPNLTQQVAAAEKEKAELKRSQQQNRQSQMAEMVALQKQYNDLVRQNKMTEAQAVVAKMQQLTAGDEAKSKELDDRLYKLQSRARSLKIQIMGNETLQMLAGYHLVQSGSVAGHPLYRGTAKPYGRPDGRTVYLLIYVGPAGFQNPSVNGASIVGLKCFVVMADLESRADTAPADEAAAKQLLASINYDGLAKLIEP